MDEAHESKNNNWIAVIGSRETTKRAATRFRERTKSRAVKAGEGREIKQ